MNKLTAEKCREMFLHLFEDKRHDGITLKEDLYMQALEIALPILEQQERGCPKCGGTGMADSGGTQPWGEQILIECDCKFEQQERGEGEWIEWGGGERPISASTRVELKLRSEKLPDSCVKACDVDWKHRSWCQGIDIIAYRIIPEQPTNQNGEQ